MTMRSALHLEAFVVAHHQLAVDLLHRLERHTRATSNEMPPNAKPPAPAPAPDEESGADRDCDDRRHEGYGGDEHRAREGDARQDAGQVALGWRTGADAGDEATLLADGVGLLGRVERDRRVEVGEADDHQAEEGEIHRRGRVDQVAVDPFLIEPQNPVDGSAVATRVGRYSTELAKMIGITPDWLTLSGM